MNKDVIYIEPEDDITDIISRIKSSDSRVVALVPPKKATVLRSAVNFKLLAKAAKTADKRIVLITTDSSLMKLAATTELPVAKNLQTRPVVPKADAEAEVDEPSETVIEGSDPPKTKEEEAIESVDLSDKKSDSKDEKSDKKEKEKDESKDKNKSKKASKIPSLDKYRKWIIIGAVSVVLIAGFLVWALVFAPAAKITVAIRANSRNFSENISFTLDAGKEDIEDGQFLLEQHSITKKSSVSFTATGSKNVGEQASGSMTVVRTLVTGGALNVPKGTVFTRNGLRYISLEDATMRAPTLSSDCAAESNMTCTQLKPTITAEVKVQAEAAGENYNVEAAATGWTSNVSGFSMSNDAISGGTTKTVTIVSQKDINDATSRLTSAAESEGKNELTESFPTALMPITSSLSIDAKDPVASPKLGEEVPDGTTPKITQETVFAMYGVDTVKVERYVEEKTLDNISGESDRSIYSTGISEDSDENKARIEQFSTSDDGKISAKLKTVVQIGPEITEEQIMEKSLGKKVGEVQSQLKSINGVASVSVDTSFFWVSSVPSNVNKVTIELLVEE